MEVIILPTHSTGERNCLVYFRTGKEVRVPPSGPVWEGHDCHCDEGGGECGRGFYPIYIIMLIQVFAQISVPDLL